MKIFFSKHFFQLKLVFVRYPSKAMDFNACNQIQLPTSPRRQADIASFSKGRKKLAPAVPPHEPLELALGTSWFETTGSSHKSLTLDRSGMHTDQVGSIFAKLKTR